MGDYKIKSLKEVKDPNEIFPLVMKYAEKTGENPWISLYDVMRYSTVLVYDEKGPVSYVSGHINEEGDLFIKSIFVDHPFMSIPAFDDVCRIIIDEQGTTNTVYISTKLPSRILSRYNFEYYETIYKKTLSTGGDQNG